MTTFDASTAVEPMRFRLSKEAEWRVVPEPSSVQVQAFINARRAEGERIRELVTGLPDDATAEQVAEVLDAEQARASHRNTAEMIAAVCSGVPSADELEQLPHRQMIGFSQWLIGELSNPGHDPQADPALTVPPATGR